MIHYDNQSWFGLIFRFRGTILESTWVLVLCMIALLLLAYWSVEVSDAELSNAGHTIFGSTMSYLLVFRAQSASHRYWHGRGCLTRVFFCLREFVMLSCCTIRGGGGAEAWFQRRVGRAERLALEDQFDLKASMARVNIVRWALAFVVSLKLHTRICHSGFVGGSITAEQKWLVDFDRVRLRGLMTRAEFEQLNDLIHIFGEEHVTRGAMVLTPDLIEEILEQPEDPEEVFEVDTTPELRQPLGILIKMKTETARHVNEPYGLKERFVKDLVHLFSQSALFYESVTTVILTPLPFPYVHLCKVLLTIFLLSMPVVIDPTRGFYASVVLPASVAMSLLGIDAIATELENPFGDDANDHDIMGCISSLEAEAMLILELVGDVRAREAFRFCPVPDSLLNGDEHEAQEFLCLVSQYDDSGRTRSSMAEDEGEE